MSRKAELIALLVADAAAVFSAYLLHHFLRFELGWFATTEQPMWVVVPAVVMTVAWLCLFFFFGMYRERYAESRLDELVSLAKVVTIGLLALFFLIFIDVLEPGYGRQTMALHWLLVFGLVAIGRTTVRSIQKALILRGKGLHKALVVGWSDRVEELFAEVARYPEAGLQIVGAIRMRRDVQAGAPVAASGEVLEAGGDGAPTGDDDGSSRDLHAIESLPRLIDELEVQDVLIALGSDDHRPLMEVLRLCDGKSVALKLVPDFYSIIGGMARTEHMYGLPLIEVLPEPMPAWEHSTKRLIDIVVSLVILIGALPLWIVIGALILITSGGPIIYRQERVGQHGRPFTMYKFRTMRRDAEAQTGPVWAQENDPRYTKIGRWLRRARLDEVPQFVNVLKGEMSLVGPRPERQYFVQRLAAEIPLYNRRHRVKPGITGWAQVKWRYDQSLEDVRQKTKYDLFYIENMSLRMDFKILFRTIRTALLGKGQ
ncbi:MAG TPA: sugar transferase [Rhodothermales bacterium]